MNKSHTIKRLCIYLVLSFLPVCLMLYFVDRFVVHQVYASERVEIASGIGMFSMLVPAIAHLLTRIITKEGFSKVYLIPNVKKHFKTYFASIFVILCVVFLETIIIWRLYLNAYSFNDVFHDVNGIPVVLLNMAVAIIMFFPAFGEEWGWRGYMMPKLTELFGTPAAVIIGGVIWGLWHAPLTVNGHNFGVDYKGFPYLGIIVMCVFCTAMNAFLTLLTEKSKSIYPASFAHMLNNNVSITTVIGSFSGETVLNALDKVSSVEFFLKVISVPMCIVGVISFAMLCKMDSARE